MTAETPPPPAPIVATVIAPAGTVPSGVVAATPDHLPDVVITVVRPLVAISVRFANAFAATWLGLMAAAMTPTGGQLLYTKDFLETALLCASLALPGACIALVKDLITIFGRLESKYPLATGSV